MNPTTVRTKKKTLHFGTNQKDILFCLCLFLVPVCYTTFCLCIFFCFWLFRCEGVERGFLKLELSPFSFGEGRAFLDTLGFGERKKF